MQDDKSIWLVSYRVDHLPLPEAKLPIDDKLTLEKVHGEPVIARILTETDRDEAPDVLELGKKYLEDFLDTYSIVTSWSAWIRSDEGASQIRSRKAVKYLAAISKSESVTILPNEEEQRKWLDLARDAFNAYKSLSEEPQRYLRTAMSRFRMAKQSDRLDDKLVDLWIGLESLYSIEHEELSYRISHRAAMLLAETDSQRSTIFRNLRGLYRKRSRLVHGEVLDVSHEEANRLGSYLQESVRCFFRLCQKYPSKKDIIELLDDCVLDNESRKKLADDLKYSEALTKHA